MLRLRLQLALAMAVRAAGMSSEAIAPSFRRAILVRHGAVDRARAEPALKPGAFYGGNVDVPLSKVGEAEALAAARLIAADYGAQIGTIWSSPMKRARFGARAVGTALASAAETWSSPLPVEEFEAFREIDRGPIGTGWTDLTPEEIEARDGPDAIWRCVHEQTLVRVRRNVPGPRPKRVALDRMRRPCAGVPTNRRLARGASATAAKASATCVRVCSVSEMRSCALCLSAAPV